jgi:regulator of replication initiation timing
MGRSRAKPKGQRARTAARPSGSAKSAGPINRRELAEAIPKVLAEAAEAVGGAATDCEAAVAEHILPEPTEPPLDVDYLAVEKLWRQVVQIKTAYETANGRLLKGRTDLAAAEAALAERHRALVEQEAEWTALRDQSARQAAVVDEELGRDRADCDMREARLAELELRLAKQDEDARSNAAGAVREALAAGRAQLDFDRKQLGEERATLRRRAVELTGREEDLEDSRQLVEQRIEHQVSRAVEQTRLRLDALEQRHADLLADNEQLEQRLAGYDRLQRVFPQCEPDQLLADLRRLEAENADLRNRRAPTQVLADLSRLTEAEQRWAEDHAFLTAENERLQRQLGAYQITAFELQRQELVKQALTADVDAYKDAVMNLRDDFEGLKRRKEGESPFPECSKMDLRYRDERDDLVDDLPPLPEFVRDLSHYIAQQDELFYSEAS